MISIQDATLMAAAAYDERRLVDDPICKIAPVEEFVRAEGWQLQSAAALNLGAHPTAANAADDDASFSDRDSGMQADVWLRGNELVVAFRGTEASIGNGNPGSDPLAAIRNLDGQKDVDMYTGWGLPFFETLDGNTKQQA